MLELRRTGDSGGSVLTVVAYSTPERVMDHARNHVVRDLSLDYWQEASGYSTVWRHLELRLITLDRAVKRPIP